MKSNLPSSLNSHSQYSFQPPSHHHSLFSLLEIFTQEMTQSVIVSLMVSLSLTFSQGREPELLSSLSLLTSNCTCVTAWVLPTPKGDPQMKTWVQVVYLVDAREQE